jgi:hypothetical protein
MDAAMIRLEAVPLTKRGAEIRDLCDDLTPSNFRNAGRRS